MITLPEDLQQSITQALATTSPVKWIREAQALSERYRARRESQSEPLASGAAPVLGYAAMILPASYAQLHGAMAATAARIPDWEPQTMLDLGSGPGTALWAATARWSTLKSLTAWERESAFVELGRRLARGSTSAVLRGTQWLRVDLRKPPKADSQRYDLVVIGHVLNELSLETQREVVAAAWERTEGVLLIVEPGTSAVFPLVRAARDQLLAADAHTIAPCAHDAPCPLTDDWCHFPQRLKRPDFQRRARGAPSEWEDSKFAYAAMARFPVAHPIWGRIIREATSNKAYADVKVSARDGIVTNRAFKRDREAYRHVRRLEWGDALLESLPEPITTIMHDPLAQPESESESNDSYEGRSDS